MTNTSELKRIDVQRRAYTSVVSAWHWLHSLAEAGEYQDAYTRELEPDPGPWPMPVAEVLMCLLNTEEQKYQQLGLPQTAPEVIDRVADNLLKAHALHPLSGMPYFRHPDPAVQVQFTDAACYLAGAMVRLLDYPDLSATRRPDCLEALRHCVDWLNEARMEVSLPADRGTQVPCFAWTWSSPKIPAAKRYLKRMPPQTYFTTQVMTTLAEVIFDAAEHLPPELIEPSLESIVGGKRFLLATAYGRGEGDGSLVGWPDFDEQIARAAGAAGMVPYWKHEHPRPPQIRQTTLSVLETLSYVDYYGKEPAFEPARAKLRKLHGALTTEYFSFSTEDRAVLARGFVSALGLIPEDPTFTQPCRIQLPEPFNLHHEGEGFWETDGKGSRSYYEDGCVPYNLLNAFRFYDLYAPIMELDSEAREKWKKLELGFVAQILERGHNGEAFTHAAGFAKQRVGVIYATRTAIAALLSWGVSPGAVSLGGKTAVSEEVVDLVRRLYEVTVGKGEQERTEVEGKAGVLDKAVVDDLLFAGFVVGLLDSRIRGLSEKDTTVVPQYFNPEKKGLLNDRQKILKANGAGLLRGLAKIICEPEEGATKEVKRQSELSNLSIPLQKLIAGLTPEVIAGGPEARLSHIVQVLRSPRGNLPSDAATVIEDFKHD